ncbi:MAG TPA: hypothetical protein VMW08_12895 [Acidimicrobiales bacterium]|nr:hypothetical protein [Acidimicrobiales bacterium]
MLVGAPPAEFDPDERLALPADRHYRLLQRIHAPGSGQLSALLADSDLNAIGRPHPEVFEVLDPRPLLDEAAAIGAAYRSAGLLVGETLAAGWSTAVASISGPTATSERGRAQGVTLRGENHPPSDLPPPDP